MNNTHPLVSIILPAYNCEATISKCVHSLLNITYPSYEIIIIDDGSTDSTPEILKEFEDINIIKTKNGGPSRARNIGIARAKGEYIAFTDSDCIVDPDWLDELFKGFVDEAVAGVGGDQTSPADETPFGKSVQDFMKTVGFTADYIKTSEKLIRTQHNPSCNVMYKKPALLEAGPFNEKLWPGEDVEMDLKITRLGYTLYYNPKAVVHHYRPQNHKSFAGMMKRYGWAQARLAMKYGPFRRIHYIPPVLFLIIIMLAVLAAENVLIPIGAVAAGVVLCFTAFVLKTKSIKKGLLFTRLFCILMAFWNIGFIRGVLFRPEN